jgi:hypothetical protein
MPDLKTLADFGQAASAFFAAVTIILYLWNNYSGQKKQLALDWQATIVFNFLLKSHPYDVSFDQIVSEFRSKSLFIPKSMRKHVDVSEDGIRHVLFELFKLRLIELSFSKDYKLSSVALERKDFEPSDVLSSGFESFFENMSEIQQKQQNQNELIEKLRLAIYQTLVDEPNVYSIETLTKRVSKEINHDFNDTKIFITRMINEGAILKVNDKLLLKAHLS